MEAFEIKIGIEGTVDLLSQVDLTSTIMKAISNYHTSLKLTDVKISNVDSNIITKKSSVTLSKINSLKGRSKIIMQFMFENPGDHPVSEIRKAVVGISPFKVESSIHSYLNNLTGRGMIVRVDSGVYRLA